MHVSSEPKLGALLKGGAASAQRLIESLRPLRASLAPRALRARCESLLVHPRVARLIDPHSYLSERAALQVAGAVVVASTVMVLALGTHFDGALDVHARIRELGATGLFFDLLISWLVTAGVLWGASLMADRSMDAMSDERDEPRPALRDFVVMVGVARVPTLLIALLIAALPQPQLAFESVLRGMLLLPLFLYFLGLLYTGFLHASGLRSQAAAIPFIAGMVTAEAIIKAVIGTV